ncbi:seryl-tRNA synthetase [Pancytospora philotis]|nr:seryl-tRNA synthetase [Pancytospora philotis]
MLDIALFRDEATRKIVRASEEKRCKDASVVDKIFELDQDWIRANFQLDKVNAELNAVQKEIKKSIVGAKKEGRDIREVSLELEKLKIAPTDRKKELQASVDELHRRVQKLLQSVGNLVEPDVPTGKTDDANVVVRTYKSERTLKPAKGYAEIMERFVNASAGTEVFGHRGYYLQGEMALLGHALKNYAIAFLCERGYTFIQPPVMMRRTAMEKTSQLSDFDDQLYKVEDDLYLIATSEQPMTALYMDQRLSEHELPKMFAGESLCFRREAGAYGKDNAGIFRVHQFEKIEQFLLCKPEDSPKLHEQITALAEDFYRSLDISFQVVLIASGELNDAAAKKYDIEAEFPCAGKFRELVSASNCTDYQARSLKVGYGFAKDDGKPEWVHMLNSTLCAVQRTLCCIVENYQDGGKIVVPKVLRRFTGFDEFDFQ